MSRKVGNVFFIYEEENQVCEFCGCVAETRPYGKNRKEICYECSQKPENKEEVFKNLRGILLGEKEMPMRNDLAKSET